MEKDPVKSEDDKKTSSEDNGREKIKVWFQENLRMIVSIAIVVVIAGGIYSYSKRTEAPSAGPETAATEEEAEGKISVIGGEDKEEAEPAEEEQVREEGETPQPAETQQEAPAPEEVSRETDTAFVETAVAGDSVTKLARRALANYLEKSPEPQLTAEHKVYIEDYLRRQVEDGFIKVGETRQFSKDMIAGAIEKSRGLNENQLKNLEKYSQRVPELK